MLTPFEYTPIFQDLENISPLESKYFNIFQNGENMSVKEPRGCMGGEGGPTTNKPPPPSLAQGAHARPTWPKGATRDEGDGP